MRCSLVALASACLLIACTAPPAVEPMKDLPVPQAWRHAAGASPVSSQWWLQFDDPLLSRLIDEARGRNLDLRQAVARLEEARATARAQHGAELPQVEFTAAAERAKAINDVTGRPFIQTVQQEQFQAAYEVDLFGRVSALSAAADAGSVSATATRDAVELSITTAVAATYINLVALDAQLEQAHQTLASRERTLQLNRSREKSGYGSTLDTAQAEADLHATAQTIPGIELARQRQELALNVLLARPPGPIERNGALLDATARELPAAGVPSDVLRRRPDVVAAEYQLVAADEQFAAARAQLLPSVQIGATFGRAGSSFIPPGGPYTLWSIGGSVLAPLFTGGRLRALADASGSRRDQALVAYQRVVLNSFAEVETQLYAFDRLHEQLVQAEEQRRALANALRIAHRRYERGYGSFLDELLAQRNLYAVQLQLIQLRADRLNTELSVIKALGGGWSVQDLDNIQGMREARKP
jgi:NodT family efflux transporter outer membrane factor (OMF) lipoprotein